MSVSFPDLFPSDLNSANFYDLKRSEAIALADYIITGDEKYNEQYKRYLGQLMDLNPPKNFNGKDPKNAIDEMRRSFTSICISLQKQGALNPKSLSVYDFYSMYKFYSKKKQSQ